MKELKLIPPTDPRVQTAIAPFTDDMLKEHDFKDRKELTESMFTCMNKFHGIGLTANQVGLPFNMFVAGGHPSIDGGKSKIKIPMGTQHGKQFRLKGKGMPVLRRSIFGDLYIRVVTQVPTSLSKRQKEILEEFNQIETNKPDPVIKNFFEKAKKFWKKT